MARRLVLKLVLFLAATAACSQSASNPADAGVDATDAGRDIAGDVASEDAGCARRIEIDFPCRHESVCSGPTSITACRNAGCLEVMGSTECCNGLTCRAGTVTECPAGTVCFYKHGGSTMYGGSNAIVATCLPPQDAGADADYTDWMEPDGGMYCY